MPEVPVTDPASVRVEPICAVAIPALNEAGKIGRVLDKLPRDGRFECDANRRECAQQLSHRDAGRPLLGTLDPPPAHPYPLCQRLLGEAGLFPPPSQQISQLPGRVDAHHPSWDTSYMTAFNIRHICRFAQHAIYVHSP